MSGVRPAWMRAMFAEAYSIAEEDGIARIIDRWMGQMPATRDVGDAFDTVAAQGYADTDEKQDAYSLSAAAGGEPLNCAGRVFATAALAWERHGIRTRPVIQYRGTAEDPVGSHLCLLADRRGARGGTLYGSNAPETLEATEDGPHTYEILDEAGFYGMYLAAEAYTHWQNNEREAARTYRDRIAGLDLDSPYLDARLAELEDEDILVA